MNIREQAINCAVQKAAYRQTNAGIVVSFLIHHADVPAALAAADLGTSYVMALVEMDENEQPVKQPKQLNPDKRLVQQSGMACADPVFRKFMLEQYSVDTGKTAEGVREFCHVKSRAEILPGSEAAGLWEALWGKFLAWKLAA